MLPVLLNVVVIEIAISNTFVTQAFPYVSNIDKPIYGYSKRLLGDKIICCQPKCSRLVTLDIECSTEVHFEKNVMIF